MLTPTLIELGHRRSIGFISIANAGDLDALGPFDAIIHKRPNDNEWRLGLSNFMLQHPDILVLDSFSGIAALESRQRMLAPLQDGLTVTVAKDSNAALGSEARAEEVTFLAPPQLVIDSAFPAEELAAAVREAGLSLPLLVKGCRADGRDDAHGIAVVSDMTALQQLMKERLQAGSASRPGEEQHSRLSSGPQHSEEVAGTAETGSFVLQQYIPHGSKLYKAYVIGPKVVMESRQTITAGDLRQLHQPITYFGRVSATPQASGQQAAAQQSAVPALSSQEAAGHAAAACKPPLAAVEHLAAYIAQAFDLNLFNMDIISPSEPARQASTACDAISDAGASTGFQPPGGCRTYYVVDINYFPGFDKVQGAEAMLVDFIHNSLCCERIKGLADNDIVAM